MQIISIIGFLIPAILFAQVKLSNSTASTPTRQAVEATTRAAGGDGLGAFSCGTLNTISLGDTVSGTLTASDCLDGSFFTDVYRLVIPTAMKVKITMSGNFIAFHNPGAVSYQLGNTLYTLYFYASGSSQEEDFAPGVYDLRISTGASYSTGSYSVSVGVVSMTGCTYALQSSSLSVPAGGGTGSITVVTGTGCTWSVSGGPSWITFPGSRTVTSSGTVPFAVAPNSLYSRSATLSVGPHTFTVNQDGAVPVPPAGGLRFVPLSPCRLMETRAAYNFEGRTGQFGPPHVRAGETRILSLWTSNVCSVPVSAKAFALNVTVIPRGTLDYVTIYPGFSTRPNVWTIRSPDGQIVANSVIVAASLGGSVSVFSSHDTDMVVDIAGYFTASQLTGPNLVYYPLTPCRVVETRPDYRNSPGTFGPPALNARETRRFPFPKTPYCTVPTQAVAYSVTLTVVPPQPLAFLTAWPSGGSQPNVSNINSFAGRVLANSAIVPASQDGSIDVFAYDRTELLIDINGYFAPDDGQGLYYFPATPCRVSDTRAGAGPFGGPIMDDQSTRALPIPTSDCQGIPATAKAYALTATVIPNGSSMPFLTVWPAGEGQPNASILNAFQGQTVTQSAIIPAGANGAVNVYAFRRTHVVVDIGGYFGR